MAVMSIFANPHRFMAVSKWFAWGFTALGSVVILIGVYLGLFVVPPGAFRPAPKVQSAVVRMTPHRPLPHPARDETSLDAFRLQAAVNQRPRKRFGQNFLVDHGIVAAIVAAIDLVVRADKHAIVHDGRAGFDRAASLE
mgnify:CR=1 FL=1